MLRSQLGTLLIATATLLAACGDGAVTNPPVDTDDPGALTLGTFRAVVSGAVEKSFEGAATFTSSTASAPASFTLGMIGIENGIANQHSVGILRLGGGRPAIGTFSLADHVTFFLTENGITGTLTIPQGVLLVESGTLTVTSSAPGLLEGTAEFEGEFSGSTLRVVASFRASCSESCS